MRDASLSEEGFLPREGPVDELIGQNEIAGPILLLERSTCRNRNEIGHAGTFQNVDIGAVIDIARRQFMAAAVARQKTNGQSVDIGKKDIVGRCTPRAFDMAPFRMRQPGRL